MYSVNRRDFLKQSLLAIGVLSTGGLDKILENDGLEQKIAINIPSYTLELSETFFGRLKRAYSFRIGVGRDYADREPTPVGEGYVSEKRKMVLFRYGEDYPQFKIKKGDVIKWTNTFDENGKPVGYKMPYREMCGLGMIIRADKRVYDKFVIHSTTDEFTLGVPCSSGCLRAGMKDMIQLYRLVAPDVKDGALKKKVPVTITYNVVDVKGDSVVLHADIYNQNPDYVREFENKLFSLGLSELSLDCDRVEEAFENAKADFKKAHQQVLDTLLKKYPKNYVPEPLKECLHARFSLLEFLKK